MHAQLLKMNYKTIFSYNHEHGGVGRKLSVAGWEALHRVRHFPGNPVAGVVRALTGDVAVVDETERENPIH